MLKELNQVKKAISNSPVVKLKHDKIDLYTKLELLNLTGSIKIRPAHFILSTAIKEGKIGESTHIVESSSGNFAIALATLCKMLEIKFIPVIDPNINQIYEQLLRKISYDVAKVEQRDESGGYLITRIEKVKELCSTLSDVYWPNQYSNENNLLAHYYGVGEEIASAFDELDYVFVGVSSGGTIAGVSKRLKEKFPDIKVIAVDSEGSVIFGDQPKKRFIPGIGSGIVPPIIHHAYIDETVHVPEIKSIAGCHELLQQHGLFVGGSSGACYYAIKRYFEHKTLTNVPKVLFICPDGGLPYLNTVYSTEWVQNTYVTPPVTESVCYTK